jgi:Asp-tRNA(Asn)/Glu-tRNA(Gln) amidotransferase A subunit family amidase
MSRHAKLAAGLPEVPLKGVPYLIKDLGFFQTGELATFGSGLFMDIVADHESSYLTSCKKADLVFIGRSSSPEFGQPEHRTAALRLVPRPVESRILARWFLGRRGGSGFRGHSARGACN